MPQTYHRPDSIEDALQLLSREGLNTAILAGGTQLNPNLSGIDEVVDLQSTGLDQVTHNEDRLTLGATVRVQTIVDDHQAPPLLREMARREGPNTFRNAGTIGGAMIAASAESELLAALLVYEADVTIHTTAGAHTMPLADFLPDVSGHLQNGILTGVSLQTNGPTAHARVARTPADSPIVAALARRKPNAGSLSGATALLALCGVAPTPILAGPDDIRDLDPPADFRGSSEYRKEMARVLTKRVLSELQDRRPQTAE